ncbi:signal peptidase I [Nonomuraea maritima]|uniref:signal peptidase I n=1 Tax=Nonomuraea maritima TaxID=683260 RepID=UPI00371EC9A3
MSDHTSRPAPAARRGLLRRVRAAGSPVARAVLATLTGLLIWSQAPALLPGWRTSVILTGSMAPQIMPGDVVLFERRPAHTLGPGAVVLFAHPHRPDQLLTHRIREVRPDGRIVTVGDANLRPDATPIGPDQVLGQGRLRVPWIGLPVVWWRQGEHAHVVLVATFLLVAAALAPASRRGGCRLSDSSAAGTRSGDGHACGAACHG